MDGGQIIKQFEQLAAMRGTWESTWQHIADNILGRRDFTVDTVEGGRSRMKRIYDGTARFSVSALSGGLHSLLTNPATEWFTLSTDDSRMMNDQDVQIWIEDTQEQIYNAINAPAARFSQQMSETYTELIAFGTGGFFVDDRPGGGVLYSSRPLCELYLQKDDSSGIDTVFRKFTFTAKQAVQAWGDNAPDKARKALSSGKTEERGKYIHMVRPADSPTPLPFKPSGFDFESAIVCLETKKIVQSGGYHEMPYMTPRWETDPSEIYGRGPGFTALPDATMLNEMKKTMLQTGALKVRPPVWTDDDEAVVDLRPGAKNVARAGPGGNPGIQPMNIGGDLGWGVELLKDTRQQVQNAFHWDLLQLIRDPRMTATQVNEISAQIQQLMAPVLGRQTTDLLEPLIKRTFYIQARSGRLMPTPPKLQEMVERGGKLRIEYVSPVARAQRDRDAKAIVDVYTVGANLAAADPTVLDVMDSEEALRLISQYKGAPSRVLRSRESVMRMREARAEQQQMQQQRDQAIQTAETAAKILPALQEAGVA